MAGSAAAYFETDESTINWLSTSFLFAFCFVTPLTIFLLHYGPKHSILAASGLLLAGNWIRYAGTRSFGGGGGSGAFGAVFFGQILTGLAQPFVLAAPTRYSDLWFTSRGRVAATALPSLANPLGAALGQLIVPFWVSVPADVPNAVLYVAIIVRPLSSLYTALSFISPTFSFMSLTLFFTSTLSFLTSTLSFISSTLPPSFRLSAFRLLPTPS